MTSLSDVAEMGKNAISESQVESFLKVLWALEGWENGKEFVPIANAIFLLKMHFRNYRDGLDEGGDVEETKIGKIEMLNVWASGKYLESADVCCDCREIFKRKR